LSFAAALALALAPALASCGSDAAFGPAGVQELSVRLPEAPAAWAFLPLLRLELRWRDADGGFRSLSASPGESLSIDVQRGLPQAILALPSSDGRELDPAGALYPEALAGRSTGDSPSGAQLVLDWRGGYAASVALDLERAGLDPWAYDLSRLADQAVERCSDPWNVPPLGVASRLAAGDFRIDLFREPPRSAVTLPDPGPWAPESPFAAAPLASPAGRDGAGQGSDAQGPIAFLSEGLWRFVGTERELLVSVDAEGGASFALVPASSRMTSAAPPFPAIPISFRGSEYRARRR
jgi:hypothetical protein